MNTAQSYLVEWSDIQDWLKYFKNKMALKNLEAADHSVFGD